MSGEQPANSMLKSILILKDEELDGAGGDGVGEEGSRPKKNVTFNRVVEHFCYSDNLTSWKRHLMSDNDLVSMAMAMAMAAPIPY